MPLLLTQDDLLPLVTDAGALEGAFEAVEVAYREFHQAGARTIDTIGLPLTGSQRALRVCPGVAGNGVSVRTYPMLGRDEFPDSSVNVLFDAEHGRLLAVMAGEDINLFRTAVPGGVAARQLAPPDPRRLALLGSGRQARGFLPVMMHALPTLGDVRVYSPNRAHREAFAETMGRIVAVPVSAVEHPERAVRDADVVVVVSSSDGPVLEEDLVGPGACVISIAGGQLPADLITRARVTVSARDEVVGPRSRRAPYNDLVAAGVWSADRIAAALGEILLGTVPGRIRDDEVVIHEMPGLSFWDAAILGWAYDWAVRNGIGTSFNLSAVEV